jgi:YaiO family outer membrane protein
VSARAAIGLAALLCLLLSGAANAECPFREFPLKNVQVEEGVSSDSLTRDRGTWNETYIQASARDANRRSAYARAASDSRFGATDTVYEAGVSLAASPHLIFNASGSLSPQHQSLPRSTFSGGVDARAGGGYGYQAQYATRAYTAVNSATTVLGADRYFRDRRVALSISFSQLSNVPGTAVSETLAYARYLPCDNEAISVGSGRDVESTGIGAAQVAVFHTYSYDVNDVHWFSDRFGVNLGAGWYLLSGAYNRFEVRLALRQRL